MSTITGLAIFAAAMAAIVLLQHGGEKVVEAQPRERVLPALGCHMVLMLIMLAGLGALLLWLMITGVL